MARSRSEPEEKPVLRTGSFSSARIFGNKERYFGEGLAADHCPATQFSLYSRGDGVHPLPFMVQQVFVFHIATPRGHEKGTLMLAI